ncbi:hypothetical protein HYH03_001593 [Edaphochlamys debaryana]|uniref:Uncharacterized protein n=1 Tax=Edaphochlamys debaryana TaxID=47281 RepID=A0A836C538_9CHLO|nr:hypothetical protein HYH03_001593 [Edaphochlamys debaryana]|eukprot:KAG2500831.1 hypothetical protein HYH03_001593 [Edaphochlamys debaryana]
MESSPQVMDIAGGGYAASVQHGTSTAGNILTPAILDRIASFLSPNELACLRRVDRATAELFRHHTTLRLSQPVPRWAFHERWSAPGACKAMTRLQRFALVSLTATSDVVPNLELALEAAGLPASQAVLEAAARSGALAACQHLTTPSPGRPLPLLQGAIPWADVLCAAASGGQRGVCEWCLERCPGLLSASPPQLPTGHAPAAPPSELWRAALAAARRGHVPLLRWLLVRAGTGAGAGAGVGAGASPPSPSHHQDQDPGHPDREGDPGWRALLLAALEGCDLATVQALASGSYGTGPGPGPGTPSGLGTGPGTGMGTGGPSGSAWAAWAAEGEPWHEPDLSRPLGAALRSPTPDWAAKAEWVLSLGAQPLPLDYCAAVDAPGEGGAGVVERLAWLQARGVGPEGPSGLAALGRAVASCRAAAVEWLLVWGARPSAGWAGALAPAALAAARAAEGLEVLRRLWGAGCLPCGPQALVEAAVAGGQLPTLEWLVEATGGRGRELEECVQRPGVCVLGVAAGSVGVMRWLRRRGCGMSEEAWAAAAGSGCEAAVELLAELGCPKPADGSPYAAAAKHGDRLMRGALRRLALTLGTPDRGQLGEAERSPLPPRALGGWVQEQDPADRPPAAPAATQAIARALLDALLQQAAAEAPPLAPPLAFPSEALEQLAKAAEKVVAAHLDGQGAREAADAALLRLLTQQGELMAQQGEQHRELMAQLASLLAGRDARAAEAEEFRGRLVEAEGQLGAREAEVDSERLRAAEVEGQLARERARAAELAELLAARDAELTELRAQLEAVSAAYQLISPKEHNETLYKASDAGDIEQVRALLAAGADVNYIDKGTDQTPLLVAAWEGHTAVVQALLEAGAWVEATCGCGWRPLHHAAIQGHVPVMQALLAAGADVDAQDNNRRTPLILAARNGHLEAVRALLVGGANRKAANEYGWTALRHRIATLDSRHRVRDISRTRWRG